MDTSIERGQRELHATTEAAGGFIVRAEIGQEMGRLDGSRLAQRLGERDRHRSVVGVTPRRGLLRSSAEQRLERARWRALERVSERVADDRSNEDAAHAIAKRDARNHSLFVA